MPGVAVTSAEMISAMNPVAEDGRFVFVSTADTAIEAKLAPTALSIFRESEGTSLIVPIDDARRVGVVVSQPMKCITLNVYSSLEGFGLTAAVSNALAEHGMPCNIIAAFHHDYIFLPEALCDRAVEVLQKLQKKALEDW